MKKESQELNDPNLEHMDNASLPDGSTYSGQAKRVIQNGVELMVQHGKGLQLWPDGKKYEGDFRDGMKHGKGTDTHANGDYYIGEYELDKCHGYGAYIHQNG